MVHRTGETKFDGVVPLPGVPLRHEGIELAPLVVVDPVDRLSARRGEPEDRRQELIPEPILFQRLTDDMDRRDKVLELRIGDDDPAIPELIGLGLVAGSGLLCADLQQTIKLATSLIKIVRLDGSEADSGPVVGFESQLRLQCDLGCGHREEPLDLGRHRATSAEQRVEQAHYSPSISRASVRRRSRRVSREGCVESSPENESAWIAGTMKKAFICWTSRRSRSGMRFITPLIFISADMRWD